MTNETKQGRKVWMLQCSGGERGGCNKVIETPRATLRESLAEMARHAEYSNHRFNNAKISRSFRWEK